MKKADSAKYSFKEQLFLVFVLLILPGILLKEAAEYVDREKMSVVTARVSADLHKPIDELRMFPTADAFWCLTLNELHRNAGGAKKFRDSLESLLGSAGVNAKYVIQKTKNKQFFSNFVDKNQAQAWDQLFKDIEAARTGNGAKVRNAAELRVRKFLGPHYLAEFAWLPSGKRVSTLIRADRDNQDSYIWLVKSSRNNAIVFLNKEHLRQNVWLKLFWLQWQNIENNLLAVDTSQLQNLKHPLAKLIRIALKKHEKSGARQISLDNHLFAAVHIDSGLYIVNFLKIPVDSVSSVKKVFFLFFLIVFSLVLAGRSGYIDFSPGNLKVRNQLIFMLFVSSGIPFIVLLLVGLDHLSEKEKFLIEAAYQKCVNFIQDIDRRSQIEFSQVILQAEKSLEKFKKELNSGATPEAVFEKVYGSLHPARSDMRIIASSGRLLLSRLGVLENGKFRASATGKGAAFNDATDKSLKIINDLGSYYLLFINKAEIDQKRFTEIEILSEMFYQKPIVEIMYDLVAMDGKIAPLGWGTQGFPVYKKDVSVSEKDDLKDFMVFIPQTPQKISKSFFGRQDDNLRRNPLGLRILFSDDAFIFPNPEHIYKFPELDALFAQLGANPSNKPQFVEYEGEKWIYAGYRAQFLERFKIVAMLPLKSIVKEVKREEDFLLYSGFLVIMLITAVAMLFSHSFLVPLKQLETASIALEKKTFGVSLPQMGNDEFGEMANIFKQSIAELEELSLASIVQGRLMPEHEIDSGNFDLYGKSISMTDLGGDYFDYFSVDENHFAVLIGDVAGHGVGSSLIMAMAKAAILCSGPCLKEPSALLQRLHLMICATRSRLQRKIMTFQYFLFHKNSGQGKYANAGGCSPIRFGLSMSSPAEIALSAPVLGGFKNSKFDEIDLAMKIGDAIILYTDGIVEAKNAAGRELGYDGFKEMLHKCYCCSAKDYYEAVLAEYNAWLGGEGAQDDLTMIFLIYKPERC